jgi:CRP-like cAMP-binding protein
MYVPGSEFLGKTDMTPVQMSVPDKAELLEATPWTQNLNWEHVLALAGYTQVLQIRAGRTIFREHYREAYMCFVINGRVGIFKEDSQLGQKELVRLGPGKTFGEIAVLDDQPRSATVIANTDAQLMVLSKDGLKHLCEDRPKLANKLMWVLVRVVTGRLRQTSGALVESL